MRGETPGPDILKFRPDLFKAALRAEDQGDYKKAIRRYLQLLEENGWDPDIAFNLGNCYYLSGELQDAKRRFEQVTGAEPDRTKAWYNLGLTLIDLGKAEKALECLEKALAFDPFDTEVIYSLGYVFDFQLRDPRKAYQYYKKFLDLLRPEQRSEKKEIVEEVEARISQIPGELGIGVTTSEGE